VLATVDEATYTPGDASMGRDQPIAWQHAYDGGRAWYSARGHTEESYADPQFRSQMLGGILYAAGYDVPRIAALGVAVRAHRVAVVVRHSRCRSCRVTLRVAGRTLPLAESERRAVGRTAPSVLPATGSRSRSSSRHRSRRCCDPRRYDRAMTRYLHTMYRITDPDRSRAFYEALGLEFRRELPIVRNGELEATNYFFGVPGQEEELELTFNHDGRTYDLGSGYGHIALAVDDLAETLERLKEQGIEAEREPYRVREGGSLLCFVRDPDEYRIELIDRSGK
jgi:lactoylglutathione lyase